MDQKTLINSGRDEILGRDGCIVEWKLYEHVFEFQVQVILGRVEGTDIPCLADQIDFEGTVKWDGCVDVRYGNGLSYTHYCGPDELVRQAKTLEWIYKKAQEESSSYGEPLFELVDWPLE